MATTLSRDASAVVTMDEGRREIRDGAVLARNGPIAAVGAAPADNMAEHAGQRRRQGREKRRSGGEDDPPRAPPGHWRGSGRGKRGQVGMAGAKHRVTGDTPLDTLFMKIGTRSSTSTTRTVTGRAS
jgi:hypothetical protein